MTTLQIGKMTQTSDINIQTAVETALASASARKKEAEKQSAIAAALKEAGLAEWAEPETEVWSKPVTLIAIDTSNIWQTSKGGEINPWMNRDRMVGWYLRLRFVEEDNQPELVFVPFRNQGPALCGMRPERLANWDVHQNTWKSLVAGVNGNRPKRFKVQYLYERISE